MQVYTFQKQMARTLTMPCPSTAADPSTPPEGEGQSTESSSYASETSANGLRVSSLHRESISRCVAGIMTLPTSSSSGSLGMGEIFLEPVRLVFRLIPETFKDFFAGLVSAEFELGGEGFRFFFSGCELLSVRR